MIPSQKCQFEPENQIVFSWLNLLLNHHHQSQSSYIILYLDNLIKS